MKPAYVMFGSMLLSAAALAQQPPPPAAGGPPPPRGDRADGPGPRGGPDEAGLTVEERMQLRRKQNVDGPGPGGGFGGGGGNDPRMQRFELMRGYLDAVDRYARMAHSPTHAGIAAVVAAGDMLKPRGADAAIEFFTKTLPEVKSPAVQRAIRLQLVELYKQSGKQDQALEQLKTLITAEPNAGDDSLPPPPPRPPAPGAR